MSWVLGCSLVRLSPVQKNVLCIKRIVYMYYRLLIIVFLQVYPGINGSFLRIPTPKKEDRRLKIDARGARGAMKKLLGGIFRQSTSQSSSSTSSTPKKATRESIPSAVSSSSNAKHTKSPGSSNTSGEPPSYRTGPRSSWESFFTSAATARAPSTPPPLPPVTTIQTPEKVSRCSRRR